MGFPNKTTRKSHEISPHSPPEHGLDRTVMFRQAGDGCEQPAVA